MTRWVNACYALLDRAIVAGRADDPVLLDDGVTHARLLEDVAAVGGVLRAQGVGRGSPVTVSAGGRPGVTALLAAARLGAVLGDGVVVDDASVGELSWQEALRLGRSDPAAVVELAPDDPWSGDRRAGDLADAVADIVLPVGAEDLSSVLRSSLRP